MSREVYVILIEFTREHQQTALELLVPFVRRLFPDGLLRTIVVDNARGGELEIELAHKNNYREGDTITCLAGDNRAREFSGWDRGITWLRSAYPISPDATLVLVNDTFHRSYGRDYLELFTPERAHAAVSGGALLGYVDAYPREIELFGLRVRQWVRTSLVVAALPALSRLLPLSLPHADTEIFDSDWQTIFREPSPLSANYQQYLRTWLFGDGLVADGFTERWHRQTGLTPASFEQHRGKLRSILCEHYLSARARRLGIPLHDVRSGTMI